MKEQKFLIVEDERSINDWLDKGWEVISVTAQHVSAAGSHSWSEKFEGKFAVIIQKQKI
jgi:hypothetical protein